MPKVCVSEDFRIVDGSLGLALVPPVGAALRQAVSGASSTATPGTRTQYGPQLDLPGLQVARCYATFTNTLGVGIDVMASIRRPSMMLEMSSANGAEMRGIWDWAVTDTPVPDPGGNHLAPTPLYRADSVLGTRMDVGASISSAGGAMTNSMTWDAAAYDVGVGRVGAGQTVTAWFAMYVLTPPPWIAPGTVFGIITGPTYYALYARPEIVLYRAVTR